METPAQIPLTDPGEWLKQAQPVQGTIKLTDPGEWLAGQNAGPKLNPTAQNARDEGFLGALKGDASGLIHAVWNGLGALTMAGGVRQSREISDLMNRATSKDPDVSKEARDQLISMVPAGTAYLDAREGNIPGALGHVATLGGMALAGTAASDTGAGAAIRGGAKGAAKATVETVPIGRYGVTVNVPKILVKSGAGYGAARLAGLPGEAGAVAGAAEHLVSGAVQGAKEGVASRSLRVAREANPDAMDPGVKVFPPPAQAEAPPPSPAGPVAPSGGVTAAEVGNLNPKQFAKLSEADQQALQAVADRVNQGVSQEQAAPVQRTTGPIDIGPKLPQGPTLAEKLAAEMEAKRVANMPARQVAAQPVQPPVQQVPPAAPQVAPAPTEPVSTPPAPASATPSPIDPNAIAAQLRDSMAPGVPVDEAGVATIAPEKPPGLTKEAYEGQARSTRADRSGSLADTIAPDLQASGLSPEDMMQLPEAQWREIAARANIDLPKTAKAMQKVIRDTINELKGRK